MIEKVKAWLADWRITVALVGGALVVGSQYGSCTLQPNLGQDAAPAAETPAEVVSDEAATTIETPAAETE